ncbi:MAG: NAD-dependent epimerase/dehydratase family protein [Verrucomicrobiae bacterium]|nr:NAD-dependent epimerase/dehydratase family protein [Verrucomicrobiae bacterium]
MAGPPFNLVTGATGFIGRHLVWQLLRSGATVRVLCRSAQKARTLFGDAVEIHEGDLDGSQGEDRVASACRGIGNVYHLAGLYCFGWRNRASLWRTNVEGTRRMLQAARRAGADRFVHCSTAGILSARGRLITREDRPARPPPGCAYKISKWHSEQEALCAAESGQPVVIASPTAPIGSGDERPTPTGQMIRDLMWGRFPGCTRTGLNLVAVEDVAQGLVAVARRGQPGRRYILGHENLWLEEFLSRVARRIGRPAPRAWIPFGLVAAAGILNDVAGFVTGRGSDRVCWETAYFSRQRQFFDLQDTIEELGWRPQNRLDDSLDEAIAWFAPSAAGGQRAHPDSQAIAGP